MHFVTKGIRQSALILRKSKIQGDGVWHGQDSIEQDTQDGQDQAGRSILQRNHFVEIYLVT